MGDDRRPRFRLRDLVVGVGILILGLGLILPALSGPRGHSKRPPCLNNVKQITMALLIHADRHNRWPNAVTINERPGESTYTALMDSNVLRYMPAGSEGNSTGRDLGPLYSWVVEVLPGLDQGNLYDNFNRDRVWFDMGREGDDLKRPWNAALANTPIAKLVCPNDKTAQQGHGNLSYAVNMGFARWAGVMDPKRPDVVVGSSWEGMASDGRPNRFTWGPGGYSLQKKTALMFVGTPNGKAAWDMHHTPASLRDGSSYTIQVAENALGGATDGTSPHAWRVNGTPLSMGWASAHPNFVGFLASDEVCGSGANVDCSDVTDLAMAGDRSGAGWARANGAQSFERINYGVMAKLPEGGHPYANSFHPDGIVVGMCDGSARFLSKNIDGRVWALLITPDGGTLPRRLRQAPLAASDLDLMASGSK